MTAVTVALAKALPSYCRAAPHFGEPPATRQEVGGWCPLPAASNQELACGKEIACLASGAPPPQFEVDRQGHLPATV